MDREPAWWLEGHWVPKNQGLASCPACLDARGKPLQGPAQPFLRGYLVPALFSEHPLLRRPVVVW